MLFSGGEDPLDEFAEVCRRNVRHKGTLNREYVKRKGGGEWLPLTLYVLPVPPTIPPASAHSRELPCQGLVQ